MKIITTKPTKPARIVLYGIDGAGKSTWASFCPSPIFIQIEEGLEHLTVQAFEPAKSYQDVLDAVDWLLTQEHSFKTVVIDTLDWLEKLIWQQVCLESGKDSIAAIAFGKGYAKADVIWGEFLDKLDQLNSQKKMMIVCLAHCKVEKIEPPDSEAWSSYTLDLHGGTSSQKGSARIVSEWCDILAFVTFEMIVKSKEGEYGKTRAKVTQNDRVMYLEKRPAFHAKNRYNLPASLPLEWSELAKALRESAESRKQQTVTGVTTNG
jgi:hypothetical protein